MSEETVAPTNPVAPAAPAAPSIPAVQPIAASQITIDEFAKVQLRVGQILEAEKVEGSRKLIKLKVDIGTEVRQVVAGIADAYDPASLINKKIVLVANLKPAKLMGIESNGMVVAASADGKPVLATFMEDVPNGTLLK
jgi:methionyl-tRNA synthetase